MTCRPDDLTALSLVGSPTLAPDGSRVVAAVQTVDPGTMTYRSRLWSFAPDRPAEPLTEPGPWSDTAPTFAPDGRHLAFVSTRDNQRQAYLLDTDSADLAALDLVGGQVVAVRWLDEDTVLAVIERAQDDEPADHSAPVTVEWLHYKHDGGPGFVEPIHELWALGPRRGPRLLHQPAGRIGCLTVSRGAVYYAVEQRHADELTPAVEVRRLGPDGADRLLWTCPAAISALAVTDRSAELIAVTSATAGQTAAPPGLWALDGAGAARPVFADAELECERAVLADCRPQGKPSLLHPIAGSDDFVFLTTTGDDVALFAGSTVHAAPRRLTPAGRSVTDFSAGQAGRVAVCVESPTSPTELYLTDLDATLEQISALNTGWVRRADLAAPEPVGVTSVDGLGLTGLLYRPPDAPPGPLLVRVHGGPHLCWGTAFDLETQILLGAGYRVLLPNPRGSAGRGRWFRTLTVGEWGGLDYQDLIAFVDWATGSGVADPDRLYLAGGSYGGYLVNWALTRTNRFRAAVSERSISNLLSKYGTSDNGFTVNRFEMGGVDLFDDGVITLLERSPLRHATAIGTPLLLIHGENDYRCPIEQSEQLFVALRRLGRTAKFVRFPGESHSLTTGGRPDHRVARLGLILDWLAEHG